MRTHGLSSARYLSRKISSPAKYQDLSSSAHVRGKAQKCPDWLQRILDDNAAPPKLYAWTAANLHGGPAQEPCARGHTSKALSKERIHILGIGNLGRLFASSFAKLQNKPPVTLILHRKQLLEHWVSSPGIELTRHGRTQRFLDFDVEWWTEEPPSTGPLVEATAGAGIANLVVATKASDALPQVDRLRGYLRSGSTVAFAQNGICKIWPPAGNIYNSHRFPDDTGPNWAACVVTHGVVSLGPFRSRHTSIAAATVGLVSLNAQSGVDAGYLVDQIVNGHDLFAKKATKSELWILQLEKLVVNSVINPLTAILRCKNGDLFEPQDDQLRSIIDMLIEEASEVLSTLVVHPSSLEVLYDTDMKSDLTQHGRIHQANHHAKEQDLDRFSPPRLRQMVYDVGYKVRENSSSMLQDVRAGKQTEIGDFNGWLVDTARLLDMNIELTTHERLISMVEAGLTIPKSELGGYFNVSSRT